MGVRDLKQIKGDDASKLLKPIKRSRARLVLGRLWYTYSRCFDWYFGDKKYCRKRSTELLDYSVFTHRTPLLRKLKDVDMWMQHNKIINLRIAAERLDGIIINPGETFSYWKLIGRPTANKGYVDGMVLFNGGFKPGIGGGLCQLSNLIYWMTLHTPLTVTERHRHSYDVFPDSDRKLPFGSGATCVYNYRDLQIFNGTDCPFQLKVFLDETHLNGEWRAAEKLGVTYEVYEKKHSITHEYWGGYIRHNEIRRRVYNMERELIEDEYVTENHALMMYQPFIEYKPDEKIKNKESS
ncbi:vancomycin resistance protein [Acetivibrio mesophilus]|uniref:Vancomycin resistance protein n=1 Tax=Acetivibrio mesophilus TaxID=2487273 RepID=A0A4Q0I430_9FIRM|nr:vancomycin resistance protein [Acetivibrio mesophilus]